MTSPLIQVSQLTKSYGGVRALDHVGLEIHAGEVRALCGENGAGKSTLIKILAGIVVPDTGQVMIDGRPLAFGSVTESERAGIAVMHQESTAFPDLDTVDNIFVGRELRRWGGWLLDRPAMRQRTRELLRRLDEPIDLHVAVGSLPLAQRQIVALARALSRDCRLLIMDEPTASLSHREAQRLLKIVAQLRNSGVGILYVSHRLEEIFAIADRVTVLRDGGLVDTFPVSAVSRDQLIQHMVGRELEELTQRHEHPGRLGPTALEVRNLTRRGVFRQITFAIRAGEILGLAGLVGSGRSEVARAICGVDRYEVGQVLVDGQPLRGGSVAEAVRAGIAMVPEDRQHEGLVLPMTVSENLSLATLRGLCWAGLLSPRREAALVARQMADLQVKAAGPWAPARTLSGGNQQKLVLGKWLAANPRILLLDEPTRGVDVGAKAQVHRLIRQLAERGLASLVISSELPELLTVCDRILIMRQGELAGELDGRAATQERILELALPDAAEVPGT